jgi:hypothetical protein
MAPTFQTRSATVPEWPFIGSCLIVGDQPQVKGSPCSEARMYDLEVR